MATMKELAAGIDNHLKRFEADPVINAKVEGRGSRLARFYGAGASYWRGRYLLVQYISYQGPLTLSKAEAEAYLAWLDAGNVGRHHEALRAAFAAHYIYHFPEAR